MLLVSAVGVACTGKARSPQNIIAVSILFWDSAPHALTGVRTTVCIWRSRAHAIAAHSGPHHIRALRRVLKTHERYETRRFRLRTVRGESALRVESYDNGDEDW